jgi:DNA-binding XRE family transcriptional regulator
MYRRRTGLSQDDVSYLLGVVCGTNVSRHERGERTPTLATALAYEIIFRTGIQDLYEGESRRVEKAILRRVNGLAAVLARKPRTAERDRKIVFLHELTATAQAKRAA